MAAHLLSIVGFVMATILLARASRDRRATGSTVAWLLAIVLVPYFGVPLFLLIGGRKARRGAPLPRHESRIPEGVPSGTAERIARILVASGANSVSAGNRIELLENGEVAFAAVMRAIEDATHTIHISTLVFSGDEVGEAVSELLEKKARAGVEVRLMIDGLFKFRSKRRQIARLRKSGVKVAWFKRLWALPTRGSVNLRLHRKELIVDDRLAIIGGMNIAREYMGPTPLAERWRDLSLTITGPSAVEIGDVFRADWEFACGEKLGASSNAAVDVGASSIQLITSGPDSEDDRIYDAFLAAIFDAKRRIWIATPYFVPDDALAHALLLARRRGVEIEILVPLRSNHRTADLAGAASLRELCEAGVSVRCFEPGMMHAKILLADDDLAIVGSANMDRRSFFLDYEIAVILAEAKDVVAVEGWFGPLFAQCVDLPKRTRIRSFVEPLIRLLAPLE